MYTSNDNEIINIFKSEKMKFNKISKEKKSNSNTVNISKIKKITINEKKKSKNSILELFRGQYNRIIKNNKNISNSPSKTEYYKKYFLSKCLKVNNDFNKTFEEKNFSRNKFKTIDSNQKIKNNKLNSFNNSIGLYTNKKINIFQKKNTGKINSNCFSETNSKKESIIEKIPKLSLNSIKDIKDNTPFYISPISSSRYYSKNSLKTNKINSETPITSARNENENNSQKINLDEDVDFNIDSANCEGSINKKNIINITIEKLKNELDFIFSTKNKNQLLPDIIKDNKNKYYEIFTNIIEQLKFEKDFDKMELKFISDDFYICIFQEKSNLPIKGGLYTSIGDFYVGEFVNGKKEGYGTILYSNGTKYEGTFKNDKHEGFGKLSQKDGEMFVGEWKEGKINGKGIRQHSNGDKYIGNYINNIRNGQGHYIFSNGDSYDGNWTNGCANGFGKFTFKNGNSYEGNFKQNIIYGNGVFSMKNGDTYIGFFKFGLINGKGIFYNNKGEKYEGNFVDGKKNGFGKLFDKNGKIIYMGIWKDNNFTI